MNNYFHITIKNDKFSELTRQNQNNLIPNPAVKTVELDDFRESEYYIRIHNPLGLGLGFNFKVADIW